MNNPEPKPSKSDTLSRLHRNVPITSVVDVGVHEQTFELISTFPAKKHYLFEPATTFFDSIRTNYRNIDHVLFPIALSDKAAEIFLIVSSIEKNGVATHSCIADNPSAVDGQHILSCEPITVKRFDELDLAHHIEKDFLLKVDVDGQDLNVMKGFGENLQGASVVIVECTAYNMIERIGFVQSAGFLITDMVDLVYYGDALYQFDAVLVRNDLLTQQLKPTFTPFKEELWKSLKL